MTRCDSTNDVCLTHVALTLPDSPHCRAVTCILQWATARATATCPTCKKPFHALLVHRDVDGTLSDTAIDESIGFLARAPWYVAWAKERSQINELTRHHAVFRSMEVAQSERSPLALAQEEWAEEAMYSYFEDEFEDEDLEEHYMSRTSFGNRPWGPNGFVASGRRRAVPARERGKTGKAQQQHGGRGASSSSGGSKAEPGRRARRKAKRAADDGAAGV